MNPLYAFFHENGTKILGGLQGTVALLTTLDVIPSSHLKYWIAASAILTYWRGLTNTAAIAAANLPPGDHHAPSSPSAEPGSRPPV